MDTTKPKPLGIILVIVYSTITGLLNILLSFSVLAVASIIPIPIFVYLLFVVVFASSIFLLASVYGLWTYQEWGLKLAQVLYAISIPLSIILIFPILPESSMTTFNTVFQLMSVSISFAVLMYLIRLDITYLYLTSEYTRQ
ncbi:MAG: hypothetical protein COB36_09945 [Alphaproteobacteria bacterium]|nr:MAG: hypothetical protein COB36_09945 [Alphaproteobacteria bacterium]